MEKCYHFRHQIWLAIYNEIADKHREVLDQHLKICAECRREYKEAEQILKVLNQKIQLEPTALQLEASRIELHQRLLFFKPSPGLPGWKLKFWQIVSLDFDPVIRFAVAMALLVVGIIVGKIFFTADQSAFELGQKQLSELVESNISNIQVLEFNPQTKKVYIQLNAVKNLTLEGDIKEPEMQDLLAQTLMYDERPNIRLKTVKALETTKYLDKNVIATLSEVIEKEDNIGIRLKAVKLLTSIPITPAIKELLIRVLIRVLLNESNSAIRIEAFKGLNKIDQAIMAPVIFNAARNDSSEFIQTQAKQILERKENPIVPNESLKPNKLIQNQ